MQKTKILCLILAVVLASAGTISLALNMSGENTPPIVPPEYAVDTVLDKPDEGTPSDRAAIDNLYIAQGELQRKGGFVGTTEGTAVSAGITQNVYNNRVVIGDKVFKEMITIGVVKNAYQLFISDGNYLYRNFDNIKSATNIKWSNTASRYSEDVFLEKFGHFSNTLTGYILNDHTIVSGVLEKEENGLFTYRYVLDTEKAPARMLYEMKTNSNMSGYSTFSKAEIVVTMDAEWQVKSLTTDCKYKVPMFGGVNCVEDVTEKFSDLTSDELPEKDFFEQFFNADIIDNPVEPEPDALSVLMDIFAPYASGNNLNVSLNATLDNQTILSGLLSAKIDIENISNIEVAAKLGDDLYIEYQQGALYVTYRDFKASTTVDGIMGVVSALMPQSDDTSADAFNADDILSKFTYTADDNLCTVSLPLTVGEEQLNVNIYANVIDGKYQFRNAEITFNTLNVNIEPVGEFNIPAREGEYPEILGLLDLVQNGVIYGNVSAFGMDVDVMFDIASTSLYATNENIALTYKNNTVYVELGAIKAKLNVDDIDKIVTLLRLAGIIDGDSTLEIPDISLDTILATLNNIDTTVTDNGVLFSLSMDDLSVALYLTTTDNGWHIDKLTVMFGDNTITVAMTAPVLDKIPEVAEEDYANVMDVITTFIDPVVSLVSAKGYGANFGLTLTVEGVQYNVDGSFTYDVASNLNIAVAVSNDFATVIRANITVANGIVYLEINGLKTAFAVGNADSANIDLSQIANGIYGANDKLDSLIETVYGLVNSISNFDVTSIDFANVIKQFAFADGVLSVTVNADFLGLSEITVQLSVDNNGNLTVDLYGLQVGIIGLDAQATVIASPRKVTVPNADDYILNLAGNVDGINFAVSADLLNMDISASVNILDNTVLARYVDGKVYATVGEVAVVATLDKLGALVSEIMANIGVDAAQLPDVANIDLSVKSILQAIAIDFNSATPSISIDLDDIANVSVNFDSSANLVNIVACAMGYTLEIVTTSERVPQLDLTQIYIPVETLAAQIAEIYNNYKNVLTTGIKADIETNVIIDGNDYTLAATINYNNGLYLNVTLADDVSVLVKLDMYLVDNVLYLDVNGVRVATELAASDGVNVDVNTIVGLISQVKGYNDVLDSIIDIVASVPSCLDGINYVDLLGALSYNDNVLSATINGSMLGLSDFDITLAGTSDVTLTVNNLTIGKVTIASLSVNAMPVCHEVVAPSSDYVTELELEVMGFTVTAKLDLYNKTVVATTTLLNRELAVYYVDGTVYVTYSDVKAMLNIDDINRLVDVIKMFTKVDMPQTDIDINVKDVLNSVTFKHLAQGGYKVALAIGGINAEVAFDFNAEFTAAKVAVEGVEITAKHIEGAYYPEFDLNDNYVNLVDLAENYANEVKNLIDANGYNVNVNGQFAFDNHVYGIAANVVYNNGLYVNANVTYKANSLLNIELWYVDEIIYAKVGNLRFALNVASGNADAQNGESNFNLNQLKGYNDYLDGVLDVIQNVIDKFNSGDVDYTALLANLSCANGQLSVEVDGAQLGISQFTVMLNAYNGFTLDINNLTVGALCADITATVNESNVAVTAPKGDFTTNLSIRIDDNNTVYANLDLLNGEYNFKLDDMYVMYSNGIVKINKGDTYLSGDISKIVEMVKKIDALVNEFSGAQGSTVNMIDMSALTNIDLKAIVKSLTIATVGNGVAVDVKALGMDINVMFVNGALSRITVPVSAISKTLEITSSDPQLYAAFGEDVQYIAIEQVFDDYFPAFEALVHTNSWKFSFDGDTMLSMNKDVYRVTAGSYFEFYYKNTEGMDTFKLRAKLDVHKQRADGSWQPFMNLDIVYKDGNIYITDQGRLIDGKNESDRKTIKITVSVSTLLKCYDLYDEIVAVVPQIGELVDKLMSAKDEAEVNADKLSYANILTEASYVNGVFGLSLNGGALLSKLGVISLAAQSTGNGLMLNGLELYYDNISVNVSNLVVTASELVEKDGVTEYATVQDIEGYNTADHMDFNSLYELLSSFVITATPAEGLDVRSFEISGNVDVNLLGVDVTIGLILKVDIDADGNTFIALKMIREKLATLNLANVAFEDQGGDSYLYYDGANNLFTIYRNSYQKHTYCSKCGNYECTSGLHLLRHSSSVIIDTEFYGHPGYMVENITTDKFTANMIQYILDMVNFKSWINDEIWKSVNGENTNDYGIEDILKGYSYGNQTFSVYADLSPIDSSLGALNVNILHDSDYSLTSLNGEIKLISICTAKLNLALNDPVYGAATELVSNSTIW